MKKLQLTHMPLGLEFSFLSILKKSIFIHLLLLLFTLYSANTMPSILKNDNVLVSDIVYVVTSYPVHRIDTVGPNLLIPACDDWEQDSEGHPDPIVTGSPTTDCFNASITYVDVRIDGCSNATYQLERNWTIVDSCDSNIVTDYTQFITVGDIVAPICPMLVVPSIIVPAFACKLDIDVAPITVVDCSGGDYNVTYKLEDIPAAPVYNASGNSNSGFTINDIDSDQGVVYITYTLTDSCGNAADCLTQVLIDNSNNEGLNALRIDGPRVTCVNSSESYSTEFVPGATYNWSLASGGSISGATNQSSVNVNWGAVPGLGNKLSVVLTMPDNCTFTDTIDVKVGTANGSVAIMNDLNFSLGENCAMVVTPEMLSAGPLDPLGAFEVILMDDLGNEIPDATLTNEYIGWPIMAILRNVCSGNSAMTTIYVFDKMGPILICTDTSFYCHELAFENGPIVYDNCGGDITLVLLDSVNTNEYCHPEIKNYITKTYIAYDQYGNASLPCSYTITVKRLPIDDILPPNNFRIIDDSYLICGTFDLDENGNPAVSVTGTPTLNGDEIYPFGEGAFCDVAIVYSDNIVNPSTCNTKIMRTWTIAEAWCTTGKIKTFTQVIEIKDVTPPVPTCPTGMSVTTNGYNCIADVLLPAIFATDDCTTNLKYDVVYPGGSFINQNGGWVQLPLGNNTITYTVTDECTNQASCSFDILVQDLTPPVAVLHENLTVSLTEDGTAWFPVSSFDANSYDDCLLVSFKGKRMDEGLACDIVADDFDDYLHFCCADIGTVVVIIEVIDIAGNVNYAMVNIEVQDKTDPVIICPDDERVDCGYVFDLEDFSAFGTPTVIDACNTAYTELTIANISSCGTGYYDRVFTAGNSTCTQRITVEPANPFSYSSITWPLDYNPNDICFEGDLHPDSLLFPFNYPSTPVEECQLISMSWHDTKYTVSNACYKIIRKWTVMNECDVNGVPFVKDQTIMVTNSEAPIFISSCEDTIFNTTNCDGLTLTMTSIATDSCTDDNDLFNIYRIDFDNDGIFEIEEIGIGSTMSFTDSFALGTHRVAWTFEDRCGNDTTCVQLFSVNNTSEPVVYAHDTLSVGLVPMVDINGDSIEMACFGPDIFNSGSFHPCGYPLTFSFSEDVNDTIICVTCEDLGYYPLELWATDSVGNQAYVTVAIDVQDNNDVEICQRNCDILVWPENNFEVNTCGDDLSPGTIGSEPVILPESPCQDYTIEYDDDIVTYDSGNCVYLIRSWTVTFNCGSDEVCEFEQTIIRNNYISPSITCGDDIIVSANMDACMTSVIIPFPVVISTCNTGVVITNSYNDNGEDASDDYPVGTTPVIFTAIDDCSNTITCTVNVQVLDEIDPICNAQSITIYLGDDGTYTLTAEEINDGSSDDCGTIDSMVVTPNEFECSDAGQTIEVTLTVFDDSGNSSSCTADVFVVDESLPIARCKPNGTVTYYLDENGTATVAPEDIDNGSSSVCGNDVTISVDPTSVNCDDMPSVLINLTVTASNGTTNFCNSLVNVLDTISPICNAQDITVNAGEIFLAVDINNGSTDNCTAQEDLELSITPNIFDCDAVGIPQVVILTVTDASGNSSTCSATVTVVDDGGPSCLTQDITVQLDANGNASIVATDVDFGSADACGGDVTLEVSPSSFDCSNVGDNTVTLTVTATNGQTSNCEATVTIEDKIAPICNAQDLTISVGEILFAANVNNGSTDNCTSTPDLELSVEPSIFDCDDINEVQIVTLTVTDEFGNSSTCTAEITVVDNGAPICTTQDITIQLDANGETSIVATDIDNGSTEACGGTDLTLEVTPSIFNCENVGENIVTLTVTGSNGESSTCEATVTVEDDENPSCITQDTTIYLDINGTFIIDSSFIDNGSADNCGIQTMTVFPNTFECADVGFGALVTFTVTDINGNVSTCEATVTVLDTLGLICSTQNITRTLDVNGVVTITAADVDDGSTGGACGGTVELSVSPSSFDCGDVGDNVVTLTVTVNGNTTNCTAIVTITEETPPVISCPSDMTVNCGDYDSDYSAAYGMATATDNCDNDVSIVEFIDEDLNSCDVGTVTRIFTATDAAGNTDQCTQIVTFELGGDVFSLDDIVFPPSVVDVFNCGSTDPVDTGIPEIDESNADCSDVSVSMSDSGAGDECDDTITRTWTVTDNCQVDGTGAGVFVFVQTINTMDTMAPILDVPDDVTITLEVPNCDGFVDLSAFSAVDCHDVTFTNTSPYADDNNSGDASGNYEAGVTTFDIIAEDECGNISIESITVTVIDGPNSFECIKIFFTMDDDLEVLINALQFTSNIFGCTYQNAEDDGTLLFSFSNTDPNEFFDTLFCEDVGFDIPFGIYMYIDGVLVDSCTTIAHLTDNNNFCPTSLVPGVTGVIYTPEFENVFGVSVGLIGEETNEYITDDSGVYEFNEIAGETDYVVLPFKDDNHRNGVNTLDLILIQRHILGMKKFTTPYQMIAGDVNNSEKIDVSDIIELRKLILNKTNKFNNNTSWRFIDADHSEWDMSTVLDEQIPESYYIPTLTNMMYINWLGVKIGDVDGTVKPNNLVSVDKGNRFNETSILLLDDKTIEEGEEYTISLNADKAKQILGFQFTLSFNPSMTNYIGIEQSSLGLNESFIGDYYAERGQLSVSWNVANEIDLEANEDLVQMKFVAKRNMKLSECFSINSGLINAEWYDNETKDIKLVFVPTEESELQLIANVPNPWAEYTNISFYLPEGMDIAFNVYDMNGRLLLSRNGYYDTGLNTISIEKSDLSVDGVLYYELKTDKKKIVKKMILLR